MPSERTASILQGLGNHDRFCFQTAVYQTPDMLPTMYHCRGRGCALGVNQGGETAQAAAQAAPAERQTPPPPGASPADGYCSQFCSWKPEIICQPGEMVGGVS